METESLLDYEPNELSFSIELNKQLHSSLQLYNKTNDHVVFKMLTTNPRNYGVRPRTGILMPGSDCVITVTMRAVREAPADMRCKDKFMVQTAIANPDMTPEDCRNMFNREAGHVFYECKLRVVYISPPTEVPPSSSPTEVPSSSSPTEVPSSSSPTEVPSSSPPIEVPSLVADNIAESSSGTSTCENEISIVSEVISSHKEPHDDDAVVQTNTRKLLLVQPRKHRSLKLKKDQYCLFQLSNLTKDHVAFMVKITSSKYSAHPNIGIILPSSTYEIAVKVQGQSKDKSDIQSEDKFVVHSFIAIPAAKVENFSPEMFNGGSTIEECDLQVIQISEQEKIIYHHAELLIKGFFACLLGLVSWYLMKQTLSLIWSLTIVIIMLMMKMLKKLVSESVEDWVVKVLINIVTHLLSIVQRRKSKESGKKEQLLPDEL